MSRLSIRPVLSLASLLGAALLASPADAQVYGTKNMPAQLYEMDLDTGTATLVADNLSFTSVACARSPRTGLIYMLGNAGINPLATWDPDTGIETIINNGESQQYHRLGFDEMNNLYGIPLNTKRLFKIDPRTGENVSLGDITGVGTAGATGDLTFRPGITDSFDYVIGSQYFSVDIATLTATFIANLPFDSTGLSCQADGTLYASSKTELWELDPDTGAATLVGPYGFGNINDISGGLQPPSVWMEATDESLGENDPSTFEVGAGLPSELLGFVLTSFNGAPQFSILLFDTFDSDGEWTLPILGPTGLGGNNAGFTTFGKGAATGKFEASEEVIISFE